MAKTPQLSGEIDQFDRKIMEALSGDGRLSVTDLAARVGLSKTPCQLRLKRLLAEGYIDGFKAVINPSKLQMEHIAFAEVRLTHTHEEALKAFTAAVKNRSWRRLT